jgi:2-dehydro-3-deoxygluconokinase
MMQHFPRCKKMVVILREAINANHNTWNGILYSNGTLKQSCRYDIPDIGDHVGDRDPFMGHKSLGFSLLKVMTRGRWNLQ